MFLFICADFLYRVDFDVFTGEGVSQQEFTRQQSLILDLKQQLQSARDDNSRKAKLLSSMKAAKIAENNSLEQWKAEAGILEDNNKRCV